MAKKWNNAEDIKDSLVEDLEKAFGNNLLSVFITGVSATKRYNPGKSRIEILTILSDDSLLVFDKFHSVEKDWLKKGVDFTYFMTEDFVNNSLDSFPLEFFDMQKRNILLFGLNTLKDLSIKESDLRLQIERELRGKSLNLKREIVSLNGSSKGLKELLNKSFPQFLTILRAIIHLSNSEYIAIEPKADIEKTSEITKVNLDSFISIAHNNISDLTTLCTNYSKAVDGLVLYIDKL